MIHEGCIETPRLLIRPFVPGDAEVLVELFSDPSVAQFVDAGTPLSMENANLWVHSSRENLLQHGYGTGAVVERETSEMIGWAGFARPRDEPEQIIYGLGARHWRRGYGREIVEALVQFADTRGMETVYATVDPGNLVSARLLEESGFKLTVKRYMGADDSDLYKRRRA